MATKKQTEPFGDMQAKGLDTAMKLAQLSIDQSRRIMELQIKTARALFDDTMSGAKAVAGAKSPPDALAVRAQLTQQATQRLLECAREVTQLATQSQAELAKLLGQQMAGGDMMEAFKNAFQGMKMPDGNALGAVQSAMDNARSAFEQMSKVSQDAFSAFTQPRK